LELKNLDASLFEHFSFDRLLQHQLFFESTFILPSRVTRLGDFSPVGLLLEDNCDFFKFEGAKRNGNIQQILYSFSETKQFWINICLRYLKFYIFKSDLM
jgi:hypothetical protein